MRAVVLTLVFVLFGTNALFARSTVAAAGYRFTLSRDVSSPHDCSSLNCQGLNDITFNLDATPEFPVSVKATLVVWSARGDFKRSSSLIWSNDTNDMYDEVILNLPRIGQGETVFAMATVLYGRNFTEKQIIKRHFWVSGVAPQTRSIPVAGGRNPCRPTFSVSPNPAIEGRSIQFQLDYPSGCAVQGDTVRIWFWSAHYSASAPALYNSPCHCFELVSALPWRFSGVEPAQAVLRLTQRYREDGQWHQDVSRYSAAFRIWDGVSTLPRR